MPIVIAVLAIVIITFLWFIITMNALRRAEVKIDESLSDVDVALIKRHDVLTKMLDISKGYAKYERETMLETIKLRTGMSMEERKAVTGKLAEANSFINAVAENYPQLKSSENFRQLQLSVLDTEEHLQAARRLYNSNVSYLNQKIVSFPDSLVAGMMNIQARDFFEATEDKKQDVVMNF